MVATSGMSGQRVSPVTARQRIVPALMWGAAGGIEPELNCAVRSEEHTSELQSLRHLVCRLLLEKKKRHPHRSGRRLSGTRVTTPGPARACAAADPPWRAPRSTWSFPDCSRLDRRVL